MNKHYRKYDRFSFGGEIYRFNCLSLGLNFTPYLFTKLLKPFARTSRQQNILFDIYSDDFRLMDPSEGNCRIVSKTLTLLFHLGFLIN